MTTANEARELLDYDAETGILTWKQDRMCGRAYAQYRIAKGDVAGSETGGYINVCLNGKLYRAHRLAWLIHYGEWPPNHLDHINGNRSDNRLCNLRTADAAGNARNAKKRADNKSGFKGVCLKKDTGKWGASIAVGGRKMHLGYYKSPKLAHEAYKAAATRLHGEFARFD